LTLKRSCTYRMKLNSEKTQFIRLLPFCVSFFCLFSCGGQQGEEILKLKPAYPAIGVERETKAEEEEPAEDQGIRICIDPGHGFDDVGCSSDYLLNDREEKDMTMLYAKALQDKLEQMGYTVILTHDGVSFPQEFNFNNNNIFSADERAAYVNSLDVDYLLSLHCDTFEEDYSIGGTRVYYYDTDIKTATYSDAIANSISAYLAKEFPDVKVPSVHDNQPYIVLRETTTASALLEIGFISNKTDAENIQDAVWQEKFIIGVTAGIDSYFSLYQ